MEELSKEDKIKEYNDIPVYYCKSCNSINIRNVEIANVYYCDNCGCTDVAECHIDEWLKTNSK